MMYHALQDYGHRDGGEIEQRLDMHQSLSVILDPGSYIMVIQETSLVDVFCPGMASIVETTICLQEKLSDNFAIPFSWSFVTSAYASGEDRTIDDTSAKGT